MSRGLCYLNSRLFYDSALIISDCFPNQESRYVVFPGEGVPYEKASDAYWRPVNQRFWSRLWCSRRNATFYSCQSIFKDAIE